MSPGPDPSVMLSLLGGGFVAAFLHAALPTHWLPFTLVGRAQGWRPSRILAVVATAGLAHIIATAAVGALIVAAGLALDRWIEGLLPHLAAVLLFLFGAFYLTRAMLRRAAPADAAPPPAAVSDKAAVWGLVAMMAVSPGEKDLSRTRWMPWDGAMSGGALASSRRRMESTNTPVALMTVFACRW